MLAAVGVDSEEDLFSSIPKTLAAPPLALPDPLDEPALVAEASQRAARNRPLTHYTSFLGGGVIRRHVPSIVRQTTSRPEFYTAYTPYQAEASQGTLQTIFEFQSMVAELFGLDVANASLYDGATAAAEAMILAVDHTGRHRVAVGGDLPPQVRSVLATFAAGRDITIDELPWESGATTIHAVTEMVTDAHAAVLLSLPSLSGAIVDHRASVSLAHAVGALAVAYVDPVAVSVMSSPGEMGFDVAVAEMQQLGLPPSYGGPLLGAMAVSTALMRRIPGRLVGMTADSHGERAYALTLQAREQHIRREKATSNICTNHALMALAATAHMGWLGGTGIAEVARRSAVALHHLVEFVTQIEGFDLAFPHHPYLFECTLTVPGDATELVAAMRHEGILVGTPLVKVNSAWSHHLLIACSELTTTEQIDQLVSHLSRHATSVGAQPIGARAKESV